MLDDSQKAVYGANLKIVFNNAPVEVIGKCPRCGGDVVAGKTGYGCANWKNGCKYVIWKNPKQEMFKNITITTRQAKDLIAGKKVLVSNLYSKKTDKTFSANLSLNDSEKSAYGPSFDISFDEKPADGRKSTQRTSPQRSAPQRNTTQRGNTKR